MNERTKKPTRGHEGRCYRYSLWRDPAQWYAFPDMRTWTCNASSGETKLADRDEPEQDRELSFHFREPISLIRRFPVCRHCSLLFDEVKRKTSPVIDFSPFLQSKKGKLIKKPEQISRWNSNRLLFLLQVSSQFYPRDDDFRWVRNPTFILFQKLNKKEETIFCYFFVTFRMSIR